MFPTTHDLRSCRVEAFLEAGRDLRRAARQLRVLRHAPAGRAGPQQGARSAGAVRPDFDSGSVLRNYRVSMRPVRGHAGAEGGIPRIANTREQTNDETRP